MLPFPFSSQPSLAALTVPRRAHPRPPSVSPTRPSPSVLCVPVSSHPWLLPPPKQGDRGGLGPGWFLPLSGGPRGSFFLASPFF